MIEELDDGALADRMRLVDTLIGRIKARYPNQQMKGRVTCPVCKQQKAMQVIQIVHRGSGRIRMFCDTADCVRLME